MFSLQNDPLPCMPKEALDKDEEVLSIIITWQGIVCVI